MKKTIKNGVSIHCIHSDKFKDICISFNFFSSIHEKSATERALLSMMMSESCALYNSKKKMSEALDYLYGCTLGSRVISYGQLHCLEIRSKIVNPSYIRKNQNLLNDWINLLCEVLFSPYMIHDQFSIDLFEENKRILQDKIVRKMDDPQSYTLRKALKLAGQGQPLGIFSNGDAECLKNLTVEDVTRQYHQMIDHDRIEILVCGDFDEQNMMTMLSNKLKFSDRLVNNESYYQLHFSNYEEIREEKLQSQSNIALICATNTSLMDSDYPALKVANGLFGQLPCSYLFQVVREQHSLCYSIFSSLISYDGALVISTGVEKENIDQALSLIKKQLIRCQKGDISQELLETTKKMLCNSLKSSLDEMTGILGYNLSNSILNRDYSIEKNIEDIKKVSLEDCVKVFQKIELAAAFITAAKEDGNE